MGSGRQRVQVRTITASPQAALLLHHMLEKTPSTPSDLFWHDVLLYHCPDLDLSPLGLSPKGSHGVAISSLIEGSLLLNTHPDAKVFLLFLFSFSSSSMYVLTRRLPHSPS